MEQRKHQLERRPDDLIERINEVTAEHEHSGELRLIAHGIRRAEKNERIIDHLTARVIANQLHTGQDSAMYSFLSSGAIDRGRLIEELNGDYYAEDTPEDVKSWIEQFRRYMEPYGDRPPVETWNDRYNIDEGVFDADNACRTCGSHFSEPHDPDCPRSHELDETNNVEVYVESLTDRNDGDHHGAWLDATVGPEALQDAINFMLRQSYHAGAEEYEITSTSGFYGLPVDQTTDLRLICAVAEGIEHHGEAYARWLEQMDPELQNVDEVSRQFNDSYQGKYGSIRDYAEHILDAGDYNRMVEEALQLIPEHLRQNYVRLDVERYAEWLRTQVNAVESEDGGIYVFNL